MAITRLEYPLTSATAAHLAEFVRQAFADHWQYKQPGRWRWLYEETGAHSLVASAGDRIIGHVGVIPFTGRLDGRPVVGAWSVDTAVLPEGRGHGIGSALQREANALSPLFMSLWMSESNRRIKTALGHVTSTTLSVLERDTDPGVGLAGVVSQPCPAVVSAAAAQYLDRPQFSIDRSESYCDWRFVRQPHANYRQLVCAHGLALIRPCGFMRPGSGMIGDAFPAKNSAACLVLLIHQGAAHLMMNGCTRVRYGTTLPEVRQLLCSQGWAPVDRLPLYGPPTLPVPGAFLSLSDQDIDQYPW